MQPLQLTATGGSALSSTNPLIYLPKPTTVQPSRPSLLAGAFFRGTYAVGISHPKTSPKILGAGEPNFH